MSKCKFKVGDLVTHQNVSGSVGIIVPSPPEEYPSGFKQVTVLWVLFHRQTGRRVTHSVYYLDKLS